MDKKHQRILQRNRMRLMDVNIHDYVLDHLQQNFVITLDEANDVERAQGAKNQARALLGLLPRKGRQAFSLFVQGLKESDNIGHHELATLLETEAREQGVPAMTVVTDGGAAAPGAATQFSPGPAAQLSPGPQGAWPVVVHPAEAVTNITTNAVQETEQTDFGRVYDMVHYPHGLALIINNKRFTTMKSRVGSDVDARNLKEVFEAVGFTTHVVTDATGQQIRDNLFSLAMHDHSRYDAVIVTILSHGIEGKIYGTDGDLVPVKEITSFFKGDKARSLVGKPKLFFLQACRGGDFDAGVEETDGPSDPKKEEELVKKFLDSTANTADETDGYLGTLPVEADMLLAYATVPGYVSWRNSEKGSWFIQALVKVMREDATHDHMMDMLTRVNDIVATEFQSKGRNKQMPAPVTLLRKKLYMRPPTGRGY